VHILRRSAAWGAQLRLGHVQDFGFAAEQFAQLGGRGHGRLFKGMTCLMRLDCLGLQGHELGHHLAQVGFVEGSIRLLHLAQVGSENHRAAWSVEFRQRAHSFEPGI
jgi:hypothetical protein